jgi:glycosyltransferase involved in cell wall biosynthesis
MTRAPSLILSDARWTGLHGIGRFAREVLGRLPEHVQLRNGPRPLSAADPLWLACQVMARRPPVFFSPGFNPPPLCPAPFVFTIHDLIQLQLPAVATPVKRLYYQLIVRPASRRAFRVLTVSEYSRVRILEWSGLSEDRVVNVGNGVDLPFTAEGQRHEPGFPYVLYVGNARPHKNLHRLLSAFKCVDYPELRLLLSGAPTEEIAGRLRQLGIENRTEFLGAPSDDALARLYRGAQLLILPSLIEGFGLPALEAMACGTPVVVSLGTALPEVVGEAGLFVDPLDIQDMKRAMERLLGDRELRTTMGQRGEERSRQFSWAKVAAKVNTVLDDAAGSR